MSKASSIAVDLVLKWPSIFLQVLDFFATCKSVKLTQRIGIANLKVEPRNLLPEHAATV